MYDEYEEQGMLIDHTIEYQHGLYGKMPGTGTVGCRYDDGDGTYHEGYHGTRQPQMLSKVEAEEGEIIMQEVTPPDGEGEDDKQGQIPDILQ